MINPGGLGYPPYHEKRPGKFRGVRLEIPKIASNRLGHFPDEDFDTPIFGRRAVVSILSCFETTF